MPAFFSMKSSALSPIRSLLHRMGWDIFHHSRDPAVRFANDAREAIRLEPAYRLAHASKLGWRLSLAELLDVLQINAVLDIGANTGQFKQEVRALGYKGLIHSFEPIPELASALKIAAASDPLWKIHPHAMGAKAETRILHILADDALSSLHRPNPEATLAWSEAKTRIVRELEVSVQRLDSFFAPTQPGAALQSVFLKIDTQGSELAVLKGCGAALTRIHAVQFEASVRPAYDGGTTYPEIIAWLEAQGFVLGSLFPICHQGLRLVEFDCLMLRPPSP